MSLALKFTSLAVRTLSKPIAVSVSRVALTKRLLSFEELHQETSPRT
jgi:hypothetical protein